MIGADLAAKNRVWLIVLIHENAPWLTCADIAKWVGGCGNRYVSHVLRMSRKR